MKICVINGSPAGSFSITLQTCLYLQKLFPEQHFTVIDAARKIRSFEKDMTEALSLIEEADLLLFSYPVYTFLAPSQLQCFIRLLKSSGASLEGKFATQITTSKHFYDMTAHRYIEDNCRDMKLRVIHGLSADMDDLLTEAGQHDARAFMKYVLFCTEHNICEPAAACGSASLPPYKASLPGIPKQEKYDTVLILDSEGDGGSLREMAADFTAVYPYKVRTVDIAEYPFAGGCLGCFHCAGDGKCIYKDGFDTFLRSTIQSADAIVYAFTIRDHSMGVRFKMYDDRQFCNGHRTVTEGKPFGYIIRGDYENEKNLQTVIEARSQVGHNFLAGEGTDKDTISSMASRLAYALENQYVGPRNFYGVGGMKIFRDLIWLMRGLMKADHVYYKQHGIYDFPQKKRGQMLKMCILGGLVRNPSIRAKMGSKMNEGMIAPYSKVIAAAAPGVNGEPS